MPQLSLPAPKDSKCVVSSARGDPLLLGRKHSKECVCHHSSQVGLELSLMFVIMLYHVQKSMSETSNSVSET